MVCFYRRQIVRKDTQIKWDDVQGNEHAKQILKESVILPLKYPQLFTDLMKPWKGILLHGVSGVGKTLLAKALNSETHGAVTFFNISASTLISKWRGESEKIAKVNSQFSNCTSFEYLKSICWFRVYFRFYSQWQSQVLLR